MRAGLLRSQVHFERRNPDVRDTWGQEVERWLPYATARADIRFPTGMGAITAEAIEADREVSVTKCSIRIRWRNDITADMRVRVQVAGEPTYFDIKQIIPDLAQRRYVDLVCATGARE